MSEPLDAAFERVTRGLTLDVEAEVASGFKDLDVGKSITVLGETYNDAQAYFLDQGIVQRVLEVRGFPLPTTFDELVARPYEEDSPEDPAAVAIGGLLIRYNDSDGYYRVVKERIYRRIIEVEGGLELFDNSGYDIMDARQVSSWIDRIKHEAQKHNLPLKADCTGVEGRET